LADSTFLLLMICMSIRVIVRAIFHPGVHDRTDIASTGLSVLLPSWQEQIPQWSTQFWPKPGLWGIASTIFKSIRP
jgi:hypothetical protein